MATYRAGTALQVDPLHLPYNHWPHEPPQEWPPLSDEGRVIVGRSRSPDYSNPFYNQVITNTEGRVILGRAPQPHVGQTENATFEYNGESENMMRNQDDVSYPPMQEYRGPQLQPPQMSQGKLLVWDWTSFWVGAAVAGTLVLLFATGTGRSILSASGKRVERRISRR